VEQQQSAFSGWAIVEMFGHQKVAGFVTTEHYGQAALFRVDCPSLDAREFELKRPEYAGAEYLPAGSKVQRPAEPGFSKLVGPGAVYSINPCTEEVVREFIESSRRLPLIVLSRPAAAVAQIEAQDGDDDDDDSDFEDCEIPY
jgi:hypothetical protein